MAQRQAYLSLNLKEGNSQSAHFAPWSRMQQVEAWLDQQLEALPHGQWWAEDYKLLRGQGWKWKDAFCIVWMSLASDDRGTLGTVEALTDFLGVSRRWYYNRLTRFPVMERIAERLQLRRLRGARLAEVDEVTYIAAIGEKSSATDRQLYYKRAGVWSEQVAVVAEEEGPEEYRDVRGLSTSALRDEIEQLYAEHQEDETGEAPGPAAGAEASAKPGGDGD